LLLKSLLVRYQQFAPQPFDSRQHVQLLASFEAYVAVTSHDIKTHTHQAGKVTLAGFTGKVNLRYIDHAPELMCALGRLGEFAFYSGVGAKTPYGMGQVRVVRQSTCPKAKNSLSQTSSGGD
jgi:CRISPR-associated endoribonuclease Cas6